MLMFTDTQKKKILAAIEQHFVEKRNDLFLRAAIEKALGRKIAWTGKVLWCIDFLAIEGDDATRRAGPNSGKSWYKPRPYDAKTVEQFFTHLDQAIETGDVHVSW
jgi:hypothetical protein